MRIRLGPQGFSTVNRRPILAAQLVDDLESAVDGQMVHSTGMRLGKLPAMIGTKRLPLYRAEDVMIVSNADKQEVMLELEGLLRDAGRDDQLLPAHIR